MARSKRKSRAHWLPIVLPDFGLTFENVGDSEIENDAEYFCSQEEARGDPLDMDFEPNHPKELRINQSDFCSLLWEATNWDHAISKMWEAHTASMSGVLNWATATLYIEFEHEEGRNARIRLSDAKRLLSHARKDKFRSFEIVWDPTSSQSLAAQKCLPIAEWTASDLGDLLKAALMQGRDVVDTKLSVFERELRRAQGLPITRYKEGHSAEELQEKLIYDTYDDSHEVWMNSVDWNKFKKLKQEAREEKFNKLSEIERKHIMQTYPYYDNMFHLPRCPLTLELPFPKVDRRI